MNDYPFEYYTTIFFWSNDKSLLQILEEVAFSLDLKVFKEENYTDILAVPYFYAVIDGNNLNEDILSWLEEFWEEKVPDIPTVLLTSMPKTAIPESIRKNFVKPPKGITHQWLRKSIQKFIF